MKIKFNTMIFLKSLFLLALLNDFHLFQPVDHRL